MALSGHDPLLGDILGDPKKNDPVPGGEKKDRMNEANRQAVASSAKRPLKKFAVKSFDTQ
jgi:hypothetical protein